MHDLQLNSKDDWSYSLSAVKRVIDKEDRWENAQTYRINRFSLLRHWNCSCPESETIDGLTVLLFCDVHIDMGVTLELPSCSLWM